MSSRSSHPFLTSLRRVALLALGLAACGGGGAADALATPSTTAPNAVVVPASPSPTTTDDGATPSAAEAAFPVTIEAEGGPVTVPEQPDSIVSLSPTATEMLFAIGAGDQVVAVDEQSDFPESAPVTDLSGFQPNIEAIAAYQPDLVVVSDDATAETSLAASLEELGVPVVNVPAPTTVEGTYVQLEHLGQATGHVEEAAEVETDMRTNLERILASAPDMAEAPVIYHELDPSFYSATSATFIGSIYEMFGARNIADEAEDAAEYPQLSAEFIVESDPDVIFLADSDCCGVTAESLAERPGWGQITAVRQGNVVELDEDVSSRWGPRVVDFAETVGNALAAAAPAASS